MKNKIKVVDLFAGVGGLSFGFAKDSQFEIMAANEILPQMAKAYELNHPSVKVYCKSVSDFGLSDLKKDFGTKKGEVDLVIGGPPCQAYSTVGKRILSDPRASLFKEYYRVLKELNPKAFIYENVRGLLSMNKGELFKEILFLFRSLGFEVHFKLLNAADFGTPQVRERVILVGTKLKSSFEFLSPTHFDVLKQHGKSSNVRNHISKDLSLTQEALRQKEDPSFTQEALQPYLTLSDAISDLPLIGNDEEGLEYSQKAQNNFQRWMRKNAPKKIRDHNSPRNNEKLIRIMEALPEGGSPKDLPKELRPSSGFGNTYSKLWWDRPSTTITRNLSTPSSSRCIHPKAPRPLTTREGARLQGFPDDYIFYGSRGDKNLQIGNAVPTFLSIALKDSLKKHFL